MIGCKINSKLYKKNDWLQDNSKLYKKNDWLQGKFKVIQEK